MNGCRMEDINTLPLESGQNQDFTPSPFSIKEALILIWVRCFFGTIDHHLLGLLASQIKFLFLAPTFHLSIY